MRILPLAMAISILSQPLSADNDQAATAPGNAQRVESRAMYFRIEIFQRFRSRRTQYDRYRRQADDVLRAWNRLSNQVGPQKALEWFAAAERAVRRGDEKPPAIPAILASELKKLPESRQPTVPPLPKLPRRTIEAIRIDRPLATPTAPELNPTIVDLPIEESTLPKPTSREVVNPTLDSQALPPSPPAPATEPAPAVQDTTGQGGSVVKSLGRALWQGVRGSAK